MQSQAYSFIGSLKEGAIQRHLEGAIISDELPAA